MQRLAIIGAGSWGTALSIVLAPRFERIRLWAHDPGLAVEMAASRQNAPYLPGFDLPGAVQPVQRLDVALEAAECVVLAVPSRHLRGVLKEAVPHLTGREILVSATKGIETGSLFRMSEVIRQECGSHFEAAIGVLSGPTFAREVANGEPAAVVIASDQHGPAAAVQQAFSGPAFRLYTNSDPAGVEVGASLKNVIAIGAGIVHGLGLGNNTLAALVTRGLAEITRLASALGGRPQTLAGLAGLGDLLLTCTGELSRNRRVGVELARGQSLDAILSSTRMIAEGVETAFAAAELAARHGIEMPITAQMNCVLRDGKSPAAAVRDLMERSLKSE